MKQSYKHKQKQAWLLQKISKLTFNDRIESMTELDPNHDRYFAYKYT